MPPGAAGLWPCPALLTRRSRRSARRSGRRPPRSRDAPTTFWCKLQNENECFFLRIHGPGDFRWKGSDLGVLVTKGRLQTEEPAVTGAVVEPDLAASDEPTAPDLISTGNRRRPP